MNRNSCLQHHDGIARDLGNNLSVMNGSGKVTIISFNYTLPTKDAFYNAFVKYCKLGNVINSNAGWISIQRKDRNEMVV